MICVKKTAEIDGAKTQIVVDRFTGHRVKDEFMEETYLAFMEMIEQEKKLEALLKGGSA